MGGKSAIKATDDRLIFDGRSAGAPYQKGVFNVQPENMDDYQVRCNRCRNQRGSGS